MKERNYPIRQIMVALLTCLVMIAGAFAMTKTEVRAEDDSDAITYCDAFTFSAKVSTNVAKPGKQVTWDIKVKNTMKGVRTFSWTA